MRAREPVIVARLRGRVRASVDVLTRTVGPPPRPSRRAQFFDGVLAVGFAFVSLLAVTRQGGDGGAVYVTPGGFAVPAAVGTPPRDFVAALITSLSLAGRRRYPVTVLWVVVVAMAQMKGAAAVPEFLACVIAAYSAAAYADRQAWAYVSLALAALLVTKRFHQVIPTIPKVGVAFLLIVPIAAAGSTIRTWKMRVDEGQERMRAMEREQEEAMRRAVEDERSRIARELHDVVTHNVSVMVVQAGAARKVLRASPDQATEALLAVEASGRSAMAELRQVMGLLNSANCAANSAASSAAGAASSAAAGSATDATAGATAPDDAELAPQPGIDQLPALVGRVRDAGLAVTYTETGTPRPLPQGIGLAAYRVVQEALTNTVKHAVGASAHVTVTHREDLLRVEVTDTGGVPGRSADTGNGRGLLGLRERLAVYGGSLETERRLTGGFRVLAVIPLAANGAIDPLRERV